MKTLFKFAFVAAIAAVAGYNVYKSQSVMNGMSDFALANVEALARSESNPNISYGYRLVNCMDGEGVIIGNKCELYIPNAECDNRSIWGNCR